MGDASSIALGLLPLFVLHRVGPESIFLGLWPNSEIYFLPSIIYLKKKYHNQEKVLVFFCFFPQKANDISIDYIEVFLSIVYTESSLFGFDLFVKNIKIFHSDFCEKLKDCISLTSGMRL